MYILSKKPQQQQQKEKFHFHRPFHASQRSIRHTCSHYIPSKSYGLVRLEYVVRLCAHFHGDTHSGAWHFKEFAPLWVKENSVTDPSVQNKDLSSTVVFSSQTRGVCVGLTEPGLRLFFIYLIRYQGLAKHEMTLVKSSKIQRRERKKVSVMYFTAQILLCFDSWYNVEWSPATQQCRTPYWCNFSLTYDSLL